MYFKFKLLYVRAFLLATVGVCGTGREVLSAVDRDPAEAASSSDPAGIGALAALRTVRPLRGKSKQLLAHLHCEPARG